MIGQRRHFYLRLALFFSVALLFISSISHAGSWLAWSAAGVYELDVYWRDPPEVNQTWPLRLFAFLFGTVAHAQAADHFLETIQFTILEEGAVEECCSS